MYPLEVAGSVPTGDVARNKEACCPTCLLIGRVGRGTGHHSLVGSVQQSLKDKAGRSASLRSLPQQLDGCFGLVINWPVTEPAGREPGNQPDEGLQE